MNNTSTAQRGSRSGRQSLFHRDLLTSSSSLSRTTSLKNAFNTPAQAAAATALLRDSLGETPPPPNFTLDERLDSSPEIISSWDYTFAAPEHRSSPQSRSGLSYTSNNGAGPSISNNNYSSVLRPGLGNAPMETANTTQAAMPNYALGPGFHGAQHNQAPGTSSSNWWSPANGGSSGEGGERGGVFNVSGVVQQEQQQPGGLLTLPPPREIVRLDIQRDAGFNGRVADEEEWVTVFGFSPSDTNLVLREFEKCGVILKHVPGPGDANWMHILYQNHYDAQKALQKNGIQINGILIIGVKPLDPQQRLALCEKANNGFMILPPQSHGRSLAQNPSTKALSRPYYLQSNEPSQRPTNAMALPSKSTISKIVDYMFGV